MDQFKGKVTIADGAWGTELDKLGCPAGYCREEWNLSKPELVRSVADAYVAAGAEIILTNTLGANRFMLERHDLAGRVQQINVAGARISKQAAGGKAMVFGSIGPSGGMVLMGEVTPEDLHAAFKEQAEALAEGGADGLVLETMTELAEIEAALQAAKSTGLPVVACMTFDSGREKTDTAMGVSAEKAARRLVELGADLVGCNCGVGVDSYVKVTAMMRAVVDCPLWIKPNAGQPEIEGGNIVYPMTPSEFAERAGELAVAGANVVGGCCGTTPETIRALRAALGK